MHAIKDIHYCIYKLSQTHIKGIVEYLQAINSGLRSDTFILLRITRITQHKHCIILQILLVIVADTSVEVPTLLEYRNCRLWYSLFHVSTSPFSIFIRTLFLSHVHSRLVLDYNWNENIKLGMRTTFKNIAIRVSRV